MSLGIIIQARMGSQRLPGKSLKLLAGVPLIEHCYKQCLKAKIEKVVFAIPDSKEDQILYNYLSNKNIPVNCGDMDNLVSRFEATASKFSIDTIVRVTGDNPLIDPNLVSQLVTLYKSKKIDYATTRHWDGNKFSGGYAKGLGIDMFSRIQLKKMLNEELSVEEKEHIVYYFVNRNKEYTISELSPTNECLSTFSVDTDHDLRRIEKIINYLDANNLEFRYENYCNLPKELRV